MPVLRIFFSTFSLLFLVGCGLDNSGSANLFMPISGINFVNTIPENDSINIINYEYLYNGGGVGIGDFNRDGRPDLVFSGNLVSSALYLQRPDWEFTDITEQAGLTTRAWCAGVNVSDFDGNGWEDIYFATLNLSGANDVPNLLFLNDGLNQEGIPQFREAAAEFGLNDLGYCTHSAWFDYENDGDLDLYVLNNAIETYNRNVAKGTDTTGRGKSTDRIYLNTPIDQSEDGGLRTPHWIPQPIKTEGWGLGIAVQDFNQDNFADIYVANDFLSNDFMLINQQGNGFRDEIKERAPHQSRNAMGVDVADLTGDGASEIMVVDMLPDDNLRQKTMFGDVPHQGHRVEVERGYTKQFVRNTLQLNNGSGEFSDVAFQAGVAATDWSWAPLLADFDNDGDRDIFVSNGYPKDITNKDFIDFSEQSTMFGTREKQLESVTESLREVGGVHQPNYFFRNDGALNFSQPGNDWLPQQPTYSNGAVFVDLDRDGDLDLVAGNVGLNTPYHASEDKPMVLYADDFDENGAIDPILTIFNGDLAYPVAPRNTLARQLPGFKRQFPNFAAYGAFTVQRLPQLSASGFRLAATELRSLYLENDGSGKFTVRPLPAEAQTAPIRAMLPTTLPDGRPALLAVQNDEATEPLGGPFNAGSGFALTLRSGALEIISDYINVRQDTRSFVRLRDGKGSSRLLAGINGAGMRLIVPND